MIQFSLTLSPNQIACLEAVRAITDGECQAIGDLRHWYAGTRLLFSERLIEHDLRDAFGREPHDAGYHPLGGEDRKRHCWRITEKGRIVLRLVHLDVQDFAGDIQKKVAAATVTANQLAEQAADDERRRPNITLREPATKE